MQNLRPSYAKVIYQQPCCDYPYSGGISGSGISWAICKSAPCSRQITMPAPHHSATHHGYQQAGGRVYMSLIRKLTNKVELMTFTAVAVCQHFGVGVLRSSTHQPREELLEQRRRLGNKQRHTTNMSVACTHTHTVQIWTAGLWSNQALCCSSGIV